MRHGLWRIPLFATGAIVGFIVAMPLAYWRFLEFEPKVTVGNIAQASATILVGLLVASYIQRNTHADRKEKDILLSHLDSVLLVLKEVEKIKDGGVLTDITASLKKLAMSCNAFTEMAKFLNYPVTVTSQANFEAGVRLLRKLATDTPIVQIEDHAKNSAMSTEVRDGIIKLAREKQLSLETEVHNFRIRTFKTQVLINRSYPTT